MNDDFFDDIPDDVLDGDIPATSGDLEDPADIIADVRSEDNFAPADENQETLLAYATQNKDIWVKAATVLKPEYFEPEYRRAVKFVSDYYRKTGSIPPQRIIQSETSVKIPVVDPDEATREDVTEYILDQLDNFCRSQAYLLHADEVAAEWGRTKGNMSRQTIAKFIEESRDIANISINRDLGINVYTDTQEYLEKDKKFGAIPTGLEFLDLAFDGGVAQPSLNIVSAASGQGKSIFLQNIAFNYSVASHNVVLYSLELEYPTIQKRFTAIATDTDIRLVNNDIYGLSHRMKRLGGLYGQLRVFKMPMRSSMLDIESHYRDLCLETGLHFDVVCIDYMDVMSTVDKTISREKIHVKDQDIAEDMNNFLHEHHIIGWTASQQTKTAVEEKELKTSNVSGGTFKVNTADNLIMLRRNEEEREQGITWALIKKARSSGGVNTKIPLKWANGSQRMTDGDHDLFIKENPHLFGKKSQELRDKDNDGVSETLKSDAIAQELGLPEKKVDDKPKAAKNQKASGIRDALRARNNKGKPKDD